MNEDMVIDGVENAQNPKSEIPDGFNANYLKIYYGDTFFCLVLYEDSDAALIVDCVIVNYTCGYNKAWK